MNQTFKVGDKVRRIAHFGDFFSEHGVYTVYESNILLNGVDSIKLAGKGSSMWYSHLFRLAKPIDPLTDPEYEGLFI